MKPKEIFEILIKPFKFLSSRKDSDSDSDKRKEGELEKITQKDQKLFHFETLVAATQNFDPTHKLGEGGFGPVFKGKLEDGREIAVKKLSHTSNQGKKQFVNEARLLTRVQHRNVVNLLGYCAHGEEKLLIYEYVANESLDKLLFDNRKRAALDWRKRYDIIVGVARGLLYLHEDSQNCIIHRDIKASNILLDDKWEPLIADFGMARLFSEDQTHVNTQVAGTRGYMAPEYFMQRQLSVKVDVFSFGVLVLELITGKKNSTFEQPDASCLLEWAWKLYKKGRSLDIMDGNLTSTAVTQQVAMCIQIGLLCTQADPKQRPSMQRVVVMLLKKPGIVEEPTRPGYYGHAHGRAHKPRTSSSTGSSSNESHSRTVSTFAFASASASASNTSTTTTTSPRPHTHRRHLR